MTGIVASIGGALVMAAVSTLGDFIWATWIPRHRPIYGLTHGTLLFLCMGLYLGATTRKARVGAVGGAVIGLMAAGSFYVLAPLAGYSVMFVVWIAIWVALGGLYAHMRGERAVARDRVIHGCAAAILSGLAFYAVSGIWRPFHPRGWDYAVHFLSWTAAFLPGFLPLMVRPRGSSDPHATTS